MSSMDGLHGHVKDIEQKDRELGGFLTLFAKLSLAERDEILRQIARLKIECSDNPELFLAKIKVLASMYGAIEKSGENKTKDVLPTALTARLEEIATAASALRR